MDSPQSVVSLLNTSSISPAAASMKQNVHQFVDSRRNGSDDVISEDLLGGLEIYIHQARDIHNICIYQKQDVYAKLCLTSDPEKTVSTKIINGGGRNPVFNDHVQLSVRKVDSSLKCEIWMLSRVRNYLEDQLLGFALVPVSEVLLNNGKLEKEFSLSSTDLFHSPAGFVQLSVSYIGAAPEVIPIPAPLPATSVETDTVVHDTESSAKSLSDDMDKIEFPDPKVANENHQMVEQYIAMPSCELDSPTSDSMVSSGTKNEASSDVEVHHGENPVGYSKIDSPPSSMSVNETSYASVPAVSFESSNTTKDTKSVNSEHVLPLPLPPKDISKEKLDAESNGSGGDTIVNPLVSVSIEPDPKLVQQDIVNMYMKSMQQFTESLAKMKLPVDFENGPPSSENSSSNLKSPSSKNSGSRVFYGSRAFF